jgi:hypothetical protein
LHGHTRSPFGGLAFIALVIRESDKRQSGVRELCKPPVAGKRGEFLGNHVFRGRFGSAGASPSLLGAYRWLERDTRYP